MPVLVCWIPRPECHTHYDSIFLPGAYSVIRNTAMLSRYNITRFFRGKAATRTMVHYRKYTALSPADFRARAKKAAQRIELLPNLQQQVHAFRNTVPEAAYGLHVRRTDHTRHDKGDAKLFYKLDELIDQEPSATFLLCADNQRSVSDLKARYGTRIFWREQTMRKAKRHTSIEDAAIDLYSLATTPHILGTATSSFSAYAAILGNSKLSPI